MTAGHGPSRRTIAALLFAGLLFAYLANGTELDEGDALPNATLPYALLAYGRPSFEPDWFPFLFDFRGHAPFVERDELTFPRWDWKFGGRTAAEWAASGHLTLRGPKYFVLESERRGTYVSVFGPVPGLALVPFVAPLYALRPELPWDASLRTKAAKVGSASMVAATATLLFGIAARHVTALRALLVALVYGLGTCAWAVSSQNAWQQTVNQLLLTAGAFFVLARPDRPRAALAGLFLGLATACRPTGVLVLGAVAVWLALSRRRDAIVLGLAALPPLIAIGAYNTWYFGNPLTFAQSIAGRAIALEKTGSPDLFQTPMAYGALGLLLSPSRGLLVFSPVLAPALVGVVRAFRAAEWRPFRPFLAAALVTMALQCKWFDWWGGHCYGYRPWLDVVPYLTLALLPVLDGTLATRARRSVFGLALGWSVFVQALGAWSYDHSWNRRTLHVVRLPGSRSAVGFFDGADARRAVTLEGATLVGPTACDVDLPRCRYRLWSMSDNVIAYLVDRHASTRRGRLQGSFVDFVVRRESDFRDPE